MKVRAQCSAVHGSIFRQPVTLIVQCTHVRGIREHYVFNDRMRFNAHVFTRDAYRCMVHGAWCMVHGAWCMVHGALCMVHGAWCMVHARIYSLSHARGSKWAGCLNERQLVHTARPRKSIVLLPSFNVVGTVGIRVLRVRLRV